MQQSSPLASRRDNARRYAVLPLLIGCFASTSGHAQQVDAAPCDVQRPTIDFNRWQENWGVLANPCIPPQPFDGLKYIPLSADGISYLSLGVDLRERVEMLNTNLFGVRTQRPDTYVIQRTEVHGDLRLGEHVQVFTQLADEQAFQKDVISPVDKNPTNVEQAFITYVDQIGGDTFKARAGRQEMAFDLQRFISVRDGPNVRQAYDALWADWETGLWRTIGYVTHPVQYSDDGSFANFSNSHLVLNGLRIERKDVGPGDFSAYYSFYRHDDAKFLDATGNERRDVVDVRYNGKMDGIDWDVEVMGQGGHVGDKTVSAWAVGSLAGYTWTGEPWTPRAGLQFDMASGDKHPADDQIGTFNPLFPNGYYFTLGSFTGYSNLIHVKPSITVKPASNVTVMGAIGLQWRETTADAVYAQGSIPVPGTAGSGNRWTGVYAQMHTDWNINRNLVGSIEAVHFQVGDTIREVGGGNADYVGVELKFGW